MHLVFLNQYYPPDVAPTGVMLADLVEGLVRDGHEVTVLCAAGGYGGGEKLKAEMGVGGRESGVGRQGTGDGDQGVSASRPPCNEPAEVGREGAGDRGQETGDRKCEASISHPSKIQNSKLHIHRIGATRFGRGSIVGKLADYLSYYLGVCWKLLVMRPEPDRIVALTTPPYLAVLARGCSKLRGADHAHWVMDLYPAVMVAHGMLREGGLPHRLLNALARWGFGGKRCAAVVTIGPCMAERIAAVGGGMGHASWVMGEENPARSSSSHSKLPPAMPVRAAPDFSVASAPTAFKIQNSKSKISWVPLWGADMEANVDPPTFNIQHSTFKIQNPPSTLSPLALRRQRGWGDGELVVMYSGNMGLGHRFSEILEVAGRLDVERPPSTIQHPTSNIQNPPSKIQNSKFKIQHPPSVRFVFFGGGKRRAEIENFIGKHPGSKVELHDYVAAGDLTNHLASADVHLVSLDTAWTGTMVPSKLQGVFAVGRPVIFMGSSDSSIGRWVAESGGGWVVAPGDVDGLLAAIGEAGDPAERLARGAAAQAYGARHFDRERNVARIVGEMLNFEC